MALIDQPTNQTNRKVKSAAWNAAWVAPASSLAAAIIVTKLPAEYAGLSFEIESLLMAAITGLGTWGAGYWTRERVA